MSSARPRGVALILSLGVLALLSVLGCAFALTSRTERSVSRVWVDLVRARLLAQAGVENAIASLSLQARRQAWEDLSGAWAFGDGPEVDLALAVRPSFAQTGMPVRSGRLAATYPGGDDLYLLKVVDAARRIDLNGPQANLAAILENLGTAIQDLRGANPVPPGRGAEIVAARGQRPGSRFSDVRDLLSVRGMTPGQVDLLADYVDVECWRDPDAVRGTPSDAFPGPTGRVRAEARAPINLNTASYPVLVAWTAGLRGFALRAVPRGPRRVGAQAAEFQKTRVGPVTLDEAREVARRVIERRQAHPFRSIEDLASFIDEPRPAGDSRLPNGPGLVQAGVLSEEKGWLLLANADPNLTTNELFPTAPGFLPVDKSDLEYATCEACFSSMGVFHIESIGRVLGPGGALQAEARVRTTARVYRVLRQHSQRDFSVETGESTPPVSSRPENLLDVGPSAACPFEGAVTMSTEWPRSAPGATAWAWMRTGYGPGGDARLWTARVEDRSVFSGSDLMPDGVLCVRQAGRPMTYRLPSTMSVREGAIELWVKVSTPVTLGSDEPLVYLLMTASRDGGQSTGVAIKLERFGTVLRCTRFHWGYPEPAVSPFRHMHVEREAMIDDWHPNEWHHVAIQWKESDRAAQQAWEEYDYWAGDGNDASWWGGTDQSTRFGAARPNLHMWIDGRPVARLFSRYAQDRTYIVDNPPEVTTLKRRERLGSKTPPPAPDEGGTIDIGGYEFDNAGGPVRIYRQYEFPGGRVRRFANCTIDDLRVYPRETFEADGFPPPERFRARRGETGFEGAFDLSGTSPRAVIGTIRWTQKRARSWGARWLWPDGPGDEAPRVGARWGVGPRATSPLFRRGEDAVGVAIGRPRGAEERLAYRMEFLDPGRVYPLDTTPILEDVVLTVIEPPVFLSWEVR